MIIYNINDEVAEAGEMLATLLLMMLEASGSLAETLYETEADEKTASSNAGSETSTAPRVAA